MPSSEDHDVQQQASQVCFAALELAWPPFGLRGLSDYAERLLEPHLRQRSFAGRGEARFMGRSAIDSNGFAVNTHDCAGVTRVASGNNGIDSADGGFHAEATSSAFILWDPARDPFAIETSGWYTFEHHFYDNGGVLAVDMSIFDESDALIHRWTLSNPGDLIAGAGGNRYGWFDFNEFPFLAIDNAEMDVVAAVQSRHRWRTGAAALLRPLLSRGGGEQRVELFCRQAAIIRLAPPEGRAKSGREIGPWINLRDAD